jgi:hypothetical protein
MEVVEGEDDGTVAAVAQRGVDGLEQPPPGPAASSPVGAASGQPAPSASTNAW